MKFIRRILFGLLKEQTYFRVISRIFFIMFFSGFLKLYRNFRMHYLAAKLVRKGDTIIDIGANLGYFSKIFARATGDKGMVYCVEPVPLYRKILSRNTKNYPNVKIVPYALGDEASEAYMGIPGDLAYRHGLTRIIDDENDAQGKLRVEVRKPSDLFADIERVDYIKCDVEGFEDRIIPGFIDIIIRDKPIIQIELDEKNRVLIDMMLTEKGYEKYIPGKGSLVKPKGSAEYDSDIIYIHEDKESGLRKLITT